MNNGPALRSKLKGVVTGGQMNIGQRANINYSDHFDYGLEMSLPLPMDWWWDNFEAEEESNPC